MTLVTLAREAEITYHGNSNPGTHKMPKRSRVQSEIKQRKPFRSRGQEATIALLRTASVVSRAVARVVEPSGLSLAQYNALRIIRGAGAGGIPTLAVRERMIEEGTTITRLLDKLDPMVDASDAEAVDVLDDDELEQLIAMLDRVRAGNAHRGAARTAARPTTAV